MFAKYVVAAALVVVASGATRESPTGPQPAASARPVESDVRELGAREAREYGVGDWIAPALGTGLDGRELDWRIASGGEASALATVVVATDPACAHTSAIAADVARIEDEWRERGVRFVHMFVRGDDGAPPDVRRVREHVAQWGLDGGVLVDTSGAVARAFAPCSTGEVFVVDSRSTLRSRGAVHGVSARASEATHLERALADVVAGRAVEVPACASGGRLVAPAPDAAPADVTWHRQIARSVDTSCATCHTRGAVAPFALSDAADVTRRSAMIAAVIEDGLMPPWNASSSTGGHTFANDRSLSTRERRAWRAWFAAGMPLGDASDAPFARTVDASGWLGGEPDLVAQLAEPFEVPAEGPTLIERFVLDIELERDRWISAIEVRPTDPRVVHHVVVYTIRGDSTAGRSLAGTLADDVECRHLTAWAPGVGPQREPPGHAFRLERDRDILIDVHYTPTGRATVDRTAVGLHFADDGPDWRPLHVVRTAVVASEQLAIPPRTAAHVDRVVGIFSRAARVHALAGHMHYRGAAYEIFHVDGEGRRVTLLDVPRYDFDWQYRFELLEPCLVPAGSMIELVGRFDNSEDNPRNPDPNARVRFGYDSTDEMLMAFVDYTLVDEAAWVDDGYGPVLVLTSPVVEAIVALDADGDGRILIGEVPPTWHATFDRVDLDEDGVVDAREAPVLAPRYRER